ncbi:MAG: pyridoxamine 5'-phosphate oxidase [Gammaproteobacteria bacterium]|nr:pyridoxamine 5'-phosphate oxidase [Gammaproteobacteria bacterium]
MDLLTQAIERFATLFARAQTLELPEPAAVTLATVNDLGQPSVRTVLLKSFDVRGFVFYTNMRSRKGEQLAGNPHAALCFFWQPLMEQVLVEGKVESVSDAEADAYWLTRPRASQLGAWASLQSQALTGRSELERRFTEAEKKFNGQRVPRPAHWSGYRVVPVMIEFWSSRPGRLHERERYSSANGVWQHNLIFP